MKNEEWKIENGELKVLALSGVGGENGELAINNEEFTQVVKKA